jgi:hypothetical protein
LFTPEEYGIRKRVAVGTRRIVAVRERIREVRKMDAWPTSVRRVTPAKFPSVRCSYIKGEGNASVLNGMRSDIYRQYAEHRKSGVGSFKMWVSLRANFRKTEVDRDGNVSEITREAYKNKSFNATSEEHLQSMLENIMNSSGAAGDFNIGEGSGFEMEPVGVTGASVSSNGYVTRTGRAHVVLPTPFKSSACGLVNIRSQDDNCFKYCIATPTNPPKNNASRVDYYISKKSQDKLYGGFDWTGVSFPASLKDVRRF